MLFDALCPRAARIPLLVVLVACGAAEPPVHEPVPDAGSLPSPASPGVPPPPGPPRWDLPPICWTLTGPMNDYRYVPTAVLLADGRVLALGGLAGESLSSAEVWDPTTNAWTPVAPMHERRTWPAVALLHDGRVLVAGGVDTDNNPYGRNIHHRSAEVFDPRTGTWTMVAPMKQARALPTARTLPNGQVVVLFGVYRSDGVSEPPYAELYSPERDVWTDLELPVDAASLGWADVVPDGRLFIEGKTASLFWDARKGSWQEVAPSPGEKLSSFQVLGDGRILAPSNFNFTAGALYDPQSNVWSQVEGFADPRRVPRLVRLKDGRVLAVGGKGLSDGKMLATTEVFDPATQRWRLSGRMSTPRTGAPVVALPDGRALAVAGDLDFWPIKSAELYDPACAN